MTLDYLYALYRHTYSAHDLELGRSLPCCDGLPRVARAIAEFAEADAHDGRPMRSVAEFRLALAHGSGALVPLGLSAT